MTITAQFPSKWYSGKNELCGDQKTAVIVAAIANYWTKREQQSNPQENWDKIETIFSFPQNEAPSSQFTSALQACKDLDTGARSFSSPIEFLNFAYNKVFEKCDVSVPLAGQAASSSLTINTLYAQTNNQRCKNPSRFPSLFKSYILPTITFASIAFTYFAYKNHGRINSWRPAAFWFWRK